MFERKIVGMPPGERLGMIRLIVVFAALIRVVSENFSSLADFPSSWYQPQGVMKLLAPGLPGFFLKSAVALACYKTALVLFLLMAAVGLWTRATLFFSTLLYFLFLGIFYGYFPFSSWEMIPLYMMFFLTWLPSGDAFSLDQKILRLPNENRPTPATGWAVFLLRAIYGFSFFQAGFAKLEHMGWAWLEPWNLKHFVIQDSLTAMANYQWPPGMALLPLSDSAWGWMAGILVFSEILFPLVLFSWHLRQFFPLLVSFAHGVILIAHSIFCPELFILPFIFYDWDRLLSRDERRGLPKGRETIQVNLRRRRAFR